MLELQGGSTAECEGDLSQDQLVCLTKSESKVAESVNPEVFLAWREGWAAHRQDSYLQFLSGLSFSHFLWLF